jgi:hypothetical protein
MPGEVYNINIQLAPTWDGSISAPIIISITDAAGNIIGAWPGQVSGQPEYLTALTPGLREDLDANPDNGYAFYPFINAWEGSTPITLQEVTDPRYGNEQGMGFFLGAYTDPNAPAGWGAAAPDSHYTDFAEVNGLTRDVAIGLHPDGGYYDENGVAQLNNGTNGCFGLDAYYTESFVETYNQIINQGNCFSGYRILPQATPEIAAYIQPLEGSFTTVAGLGPEQQTAFAGMTYEGAVDISTGVTQAVSYSFASTNLANAADGPEIDSNPHATQHSSKLYTR